MNRLLTAALLLIAIAGCSRDGTDAPAANESPRAPQLPVIDIGNVTVSGISSGAYMATQLHVAFSDVVDGAGLIAGGPYGCAQDSMQRALGPCISGENIDVAALLSVANARAENGSIAALDNLADDRVWLFHGSNDAAVAAEVVIAAAEFYAALTDAPPVTVDGVPAAHGIPTLATGAACDSFEEPYLQACDYDAAGALLTTLNGELEPRATAGGRLLPFDQTPHAGAELLENGYLYVPEACNDASCGLHIVFHGCKQSSAFIGDALASGAGFNDWADNNQLVILYPQAAASRIAPMNPLGCWDWWGFTGDDYDTRSGAQIAAIRAMIDRLATRR